MHCGQGQSIRCCRGVAEGKSVKNKAVVHRRRCGQLMEGGEDMACGRMRGIWMQIIGILYAGLSQKIRKKCFWAGGKSRLCRWLGYCMQMIEFFEMIKEESAWILGRAKQRAI